MKTINNFATLYYGINIGDIYEVSDRMGVDTSMMSQAQAAELISEMIDWKITVYGSLEDPQYFVSLKDHSANGSTYVDSVLVNPPIDPKFIEAVRKLNLPTGHKLGWHLSTLKL